MSKSKSMAVETPLFSRPTGCAYPSLIPALESYLSTFLERFSALMRRLDKRKGAKANSWSILQQSLALNQTMGDVLLQLEQLDITMAIDFLDRSVGNQGFWVTSLQTWTNYFSNPTSF